MARENKPYKRLKVFGLLIKGLTPEQISKQVDCNRNYITRLQREWVKMTKEKKEEIRQRIREAFPEEPVAKEPDNNGLHTPFKAAKGPYVRSGY